MHVTFELFIQVLALVLFLLAGIGVPEGKRFSYIAFGLFFWLLSLIIPVLR